jgi:hypothetical protein
MTPSQIPVLIPGAREARVGPAAPAAIVPATAPSDSKLASASPDRGQLEYARQGGGAPSEREMPARRSRAARLLHWLLRM